MMELIDIKTVAVLGAGTMGQGIAQVCAAAGCRTLLFDVRSEFIQNGISAMEKNVRNAFEKGKLTRDKMQQIERNVVGMERMVEIKADLIIEAVSEKLDVKQNLFQELEKINDEKTIFATNTSSLSITEIGSGLRDPTRCLGLHFFNPAHLMKLVEIISGEKTSSECISVVKEFSKKIGKIAVVANDSPGFIVNRVARHYYLESLKLLEEQTGTVEGIDSLLRSAGFKMGPFELMDLIGIDINYAVTISIYQAFHGESRFKPNPIQLQKVEKGQLGRKTGKGFYDYPQK